MELEAHIRVSPELFGKNTKEAVFNAINKVFEGHISKDVGFVISVKSIKEIGDGIIIPGNGGAFYKTKFNVYTFKPELQEVVLGNIKDIAEFGAFFNLGAIDGMIHISQTMDDFVSFGKSKVLTGKETKKSLKVGDRCRGRIIAISFKEASNPKIGITMRQHRLGNLKWIEEELKKQEKESSKEKKKK